MPHMILTKTLRIYQSKQNSETLWGMHHVARKAFNMGVNEAFDHPDVSGRNAESILTKKRQEHEWLGKYQRTFLRANFSDGHKSVKLADSTRREKRLPPLKSAKSLYRRKQEGRQPALHSFQKPNAKNGTFDIGACKFELKDSFDCQVRSFQIIETTKKITKRTKPYDRTYEIHIQYHYKSPAFHEGDTVSLDINTSNMFGMVTADNGMSNIVKLPDNAKRKKNDNLSKKQSKQTKKHKNGRSYKQKQRHMQKKNQKIADRKTDAVRKALSGYIKDAGVVIIEGLKISAMGSKGNGKKGLNRVMHYSSMGFVRAEIIKYCQKHGIAVVIVPAHGTSITCAVCGHKDKKSRDRASFTCRNCGHKNHADLNAPENLFHRAVSGAAGNVVCKQKDAMGQIHMKVKSQNETTNPGMFQFGTRCHAGYHCGVPEMHLPQTVPLLLEKHGNCTRKRCNFCI